MKQLFVFLSCTLCVFVSPAARAAFALPVTKVAPVINRSQMIKVNRLVNYNTESYNGLPAKQLSAKGWLQFSLNTGELAAKQEEALCANDSLATGLSKMENSFLLVIDILLFLSLSVAMKIVPKR